MPPGTANTASCDSYVAKDRPVITVLLLLLLWNGGASAAVAADVIVVVVVFTLLSRASLA
jgi:hypothetical protein